ncbi:MAG: mechanosensitive ion channel [Bauldia sp.]|nr:mechanosensitive ion channel [Bauldia sp.]
MPRLGTALLILVVGLLAARYFARGVSNLVRRTGRVDPTILPVLRAIVRYGVAIIVLVAFLSQLGVQTASVLAALGAAGLAIGLALQGTLANIAAGFMLLWLRPFRAGEYIDNGEVGGTVREVGLFATRLDTFDGNFRFVPNSLLWAKPLVNYSRNPTRMTNILVGISYEADIERARALLLDLIKSDQRVLADPAPDVIVENLGENAVTLAMRAWIPNSSFWPAQRFLVQEAKALLKRSGVEIALPQRIVHVIREPEEKSAQPRPGRDSPVSEGKRPAPEPTPTR